MLFIEAVSKLEPNKLIPDFIYELQYVIDKQFPKSYCKVFLNTGISKSIDILFTLGKDKSEYANGIFNNDPLVHYFIIDSERNIISHLPETVNIDLSFGGAIMVASGQHYLSYEKIKIGWRKKSGTPDEIIKYVGDYFKKVRNVYESYKNRLKEEYLKNK